MRKTKIICTLGPAVDDANLIRALIEGGMDAARFNFSHGNHSEQLERLNRLKAVRDTMGRPVATILDTIFFFIVIISDYCPCWHISLQYNTKTVHIHI